MSNGNKLDELLADGGDRLVGRLAKVADRRERVELAVRNILSRPPDEEEIAILEPIPRTPGRPPRRGRPPAGLGVAGRRRNSGSIIDP